MRHKLQPLSNVAASAPGVSVETRDRLERLFQDDWQGWSHPYRNPGALRVVLYRHYDPDGVLLYVGIAEKPASRMHVHARESAWALFASHAEMDWHPNRAAALEAERAAIKDEAPIFNWVHNDTARRERVKQYLVSKQAWQFLEATI